MVRARPLEVYQDEMTMTVGDRTSFEEFFGATEPKLRRALVARYGAEVGREAAADAMAYAWEHWDRLGTMENPAGYLYRVGQSKSRSWFRRRPVFPAVADAGMPWIEPGLPAALQSLSPRQREAVVLTHGFDYSLAEVAEMTGLSKSTVQNHVERGLAKLRARLEATS